MILNKSYFKLTKKTNSLFKDHRGYLIDITKSLKFKPIHFLITQSKKNVLRGMYYQTTKIQFLAALKKKNQSKIHNSSSYLWTTFKYGKN